MTKNRVKYLKHEHKIKDEQQETSFIKKRLEKHSPKDINTKLMNMQTRMQNISKFCTNKDKQDAITHIAIIVEYALHSELEPAKRYLAEVASDKIESLCSDTYQGHNQETPIAGEIVDY